MAGMNAIARSLTINVVGVGCVAIAGLISTLMMARWMPAPDFGRFSILLLAFNAIAVLDGIRPIMVYLGAQGSALGPRVRTGETVSAAVGLGVMLISFVVAATIAATQLTMVQSAVMALGLGLYFPMSCYWGVLDSQRETAFTGGLRSAAWTCAYCAFLAGAALGASALWFVTVFCIMNAALLAAYAARLYRRYDVAGRHGEAGLALRIGHAAWNTVAFNFGALVLASVDRLVLGWSAGPASLGLYSGVYELTTKPAALLRVTSAVAYPEAAHLQTDPAVLARHWLRGLRLTLAVVFGAVSALVYFRLGLTVLLLGERFAPAADAFGLLALGFVFVVIGYLCGIALNSIGDFESQRRAYSIAAVGMVLLAWPMVIWGGITGAAGLYLLARTVDLALLFMTIKRLKQEFAVGRTALAVALFIGTATCAWFAWAIPTIIGLVVFVLALGLNHEIRQPA